MSSSRNRKDAGEAEMFVVEYKSNRKLKEGYIILY